MATVEATVEHPEATIKCPGVVCGTTIPDAPPYLCPACSMWRDAARAYFNPDPRPYRRYAF